MKGWCSTTHTYCLHIALRMKWSNSHKDFAILTFLHTCWSRTGGGRVGRHAQVQHPGLLFSVGARLVRHHLFSVGEKRSNKSIHQEKNTNSRLSSEVNTQYYNKHFVVISNSKKCAIKQGVADQMEGGGGEDEERAALRRDGDRDGKKTRCSR